MSDSLRQMIDQMIDLNAYRERADEAIRREHIGDHRGVYQFVCDDVPVLFGSIDALIECLAAERARVAALVPLARAAVAVGTTMSIEDTWEQVLLDLNDALEALPDDLRAELEASDGS